MIPITYHHLYYFYAIARAGQDRMLERLKPVRAVECAVGWV